MSGFGHKLVAQPGAARHEHPPPIPNHHNPSAKLAYLVPWSVGLLRVEAVLTAALGQHIGLKVFTRGIPSHFLHIGRVWPE